MEFRPYVVTLTAWKVAMNDESSPEAHLQSSKTSRGSYLDPELSIFVKIFEFYLVPLREDHFNCRQFIHYY